MLKIQFKDNRHPPLWVVEKLYSIGSASDCNLVLSEKDVDPLHARLITSGDKITLKDNNSHGGCFVNGQRITQKEIIPGDNIRLGSVEFSVLDPHSGESTDAAADALPWRLVSDCSWLAGKSFALPADKPVVIGRGSQCDIMIPGTHLSRRHAQISVEGDGVRIRDLGSANGTFLNDLPIEDALAYNNDRLRIDVYSFRLLAPEVDAAKSRVRASIESLSKPVERKQASSTPKRWKTRPTSPGNRMEPTYTEVQRSKDGWRWLILILIVVALAATIYLA